MGVVTDPIADMLTRIRNALAVDHSTVSMPASKTKGAIAGILKSEGFISDFEVVKSEPQDTLRLLLRYEEEGKPMIRGLKRLSKPGLRVYISKDEIPRVYGGRRHHGRVHLQWDDDRVPGLEAEGRRRAHVPGMVRALKYISE